MSCRVLNRQVEEETLNEIVRLAELYGCTRVVGVYLPTKKNAMVRDLYSRLGFTTIDESAARVEFELAVSTYITKATHIEVIRRHDDAGRNNVQAAVNF
jgi:predicted enzyme involved in methoxymalonyl-ACP biosynthesis